MGLYLDMFEPSDEADFLTRHLASAGINAAILAQLRRVNRLTVEGLSPSEVARLSAPLAEAGINLEQQALIEPARQAAIREMQQLAAKVSTYSLLDLGPRRAELLKIQDPGIRATVERLSNNQREAARAQHGGVLERIIKLPDSTPVRADNVAEGDLISYGEPLRKEAPPAPTAWDYFDETRVHVKYLRNSTDLARGTAGIVVTKLLQARNFPVDRTVHCKKAQASGCVPAGRGGEIYVHGPIAGCEFVGSRGLTVYYTAGQDTSTVDPGECTLTPLPASEMQAAYEAALAGK